ncbi:YrhB family protein [Acinetobacter bereziniae]|uniref:YrhB domain-containing protein n=1 Tax=Acinetobacter TaxID=469 RepID=UPI0002AE932C|nr:MULTISPECIES: YrhB domain-containing protein [Acinetobacter]ATZ64500.1 hypothetical protein BSR55_14680 [Acinetobacter bereziniae]ELW76498.1 hypothetical protein ACINWC743_A0148 [Acinetobacter sp. WC-743]MBJ8424114.1 hypothetical protein [Acinetobacter bereziniae]MBJ8428733.1 hypothetical protein [Acinetobacter bereziniae]MBJ8477729.1 hypothetical protein [Acinetobacter bereziniae]
MKTEKEIIELAKKFLSTNLGELDNDEIVIDPKLDKVDNGWFIFYQSKRFMETKDINYSLVGNTPIFIDNNGEIIEFRRNW